MLRKLFLLILAVAALQSCNPGISGTWQNERIDKEKKNKAHALNDQLFKALAGNDIPAIKSLMSDKLLAESGQKLDTLLKQLSGAIGAKGYKVLDEYNVRNTVTGLNNTLTSDDHGDNDYVVNYLALNKDMYTALLLAEAPASQMLITVIYGRQGNDWKINILFFGQYTVQNKTAPDYYKMARSNYAEGNLVDAIKIWT